MSVRLDAIGAADVLEVADALLADDVQLDLDALRARAARAASRASLIRFALKRAGEAAVRREQDHRRAPHLSPAGAAAETARRAPASTGSRSPRRARSRTAARPTTRSCARFIFDVATISIVRVILRVFSTDLMRPLSSRPLAIDECSLGAAVSVALLRANVCLNSSIAALELGLDLLRQRLLGADARRRPAGYCAAMNSWKPRLPLARSRSTGDVVEEAVRHGVDDHDLLLDRHRLRTAAA